MGVLLSKLNNFGNESITGSQTTAQKSSLKRKRVAQGNDERSSKKSRKSSLASSVNPSTNSPSIHKTICELSGQRTNECLDVNIILKAKGSKPHKSRRKKEAKDSEELSANNRDVEEAISSRIATAHEEECAIDTIKNSSATSENATPKPARRKRKAPKSPHFESMTQPVSTSPLPAAKTSDKSFDRKSKISIVETGPVPPLAHFRPTNPDEFGLIQEKLRHDPWKMLVAVIFLNVTTAKMALPLLAQLFERWPTPVALSSGMLPPSSILTQQISKNYLNFCTQLDCIIRVQND